MHPFHFPALVAVLATIALSFTACAEWENCVKEHGTYVASTEYVQDSGFQKGGSVAAPARQARAPGCDVAAADSAVASAEAADIQIATATGYGMSVEEAKRAAVRSAVEAVVGTLLDAETLVENDELIQDKILSYSTGMVEDVKFIGKPQKSPEGLVTVRVQAKVRKTELAERVKSTVKTSVKIDGESLYQKVTFNQKNLKAAGAIMQSLFSPERMQGLLKFEPDMDKGNPIDVDMTTGEVTVAIKGGVDMAAYRQWTDEIIEKLGPMAKEKKTGKEDPDWDGKSYYGSHSSFIDIVGGQGLSILRSFRSLEVTGLVFDKDKTALLRKQLEHYDDIGADYQWSIHISLLDKGGEKIKSEKIVLNWDGDDEHALIYACCGVSGVMVIVPAFTPGGGTHMVSFAQDSISLGKLTPHDLREIDRISVEVVLEKDD